ncbi:MAG: hypothetical protein KFBDDELM_00007 [Candidatus Argoarchaeum ethanivorans]|uniref:Uncharacterized protein n=1 Tax=Candidatus Argoarchaeum ethanivorans TaxID=2608793 RepID=A0A811T469_9EURY|nr:MAG: hypothetical protein KFBDDELM_00007 [Candidatus Argoarchaeum ethanivorans]
MLDMTLSARRQRIRSLMGLGCWGGLIGTISEKRPLLNVIEVGVGEGGHRWRSASFLEPGPRSLRCLL